MPKMTLIDKAKSETLIGDRNKQECFNECNNVAFHDLTAHDNPSMDIKTLLGLGPKQCIQPRGVKISKTIRMIDRLKRDMRLKHYLM